MEKCSNCGKPMDVEELNAGMCMECLLMAQAKEEIKQEEGIKYDQGKLRYDLVPVELPTLDAAVYTFGATKYDDWNWANGIAYSRVLSAAMRHIKAWEGGETFDPETNLPHLAHARWNLGTLLYFDLYPGTYENCDDTKSLTLSPLIMDCLHSNFPWKKEVADD